MTKKAKTVNNIFLLFVATMGPYWLRMGRCYLIIGKLIMSLTWFQNLEIFSENRILIRNRRFQHQFVSESIVSQFLSLLFIIADTTGYGISNGIHSKYTVIKE